MKNLEKVLFPHLYPKEMQTRAGTSMRPTRKLRQQMGGFLLLGMKKRKENRDREGTKCEEESAELELW